LPLYFPAPKEKAPKVTDQLYDPGAAYGSGHLRRATVRETLRLQGFPDDFVVVGKQAESYAQAGNAVNVNVIDALLTSVLNEVRVNG
jgi:DNA (cytosine-5)-methyltransferase 1